VPAVDLHPDFDEKRWIVARGHTGRSLLGYNPHTHADSIGAWNVQGQYGFSLGLGQVVEASEQARTWLDGYLAGKEPELRDYLGLRDDEHGPDEVESNVERWRTFASRFRREGHDPSLNRRPIHPVVGWSGPRPWMLVGEQPWIWEDGSWHLAASGADAVDGWWIESDNCAERAHHEMAGTDPHTICEGCGIAVEASDYVEVE
jgi:hypothetical protein